MEAKEGLFWLPREVWFKIFRFLSYKDLSNVILVSRLWNKVGEDPWLWRNIELTVLHFEILKIRRFSRVNKVILNPGLVTSKEDEKILMKLLKSSSFGEVNFNHNNIKSINPKTLARVLTRLNVVKNLELSEKQAMELFKAITQNTRLKELDICSTDFEKIPIDVFSKAIYKLNRLNLKFSILTKQQIEIMFEALTEQRRENDLDIAGTANLYKMNLSGFAPYVSGFAPFERRAKKVSRLIERKSLKRPRKKIQVKRKELISIMNIIKSSAMGHMNMF